MKSPERKTGSDCYLVNAAARKFLILLAALKRRQKLTHSTTSVIITSEIVKIRFSRAP